MIPQIEALMRKAESGEDWAEIARLEAEHLKTGRHILPPGECVTCDRHRGETMMPSHDASPRCESGRHNHCTCDTCF